MQSKYDFNTQKIDLCQKKIPTVSLDEETEGFRTKTSIFLSPK